MNIVEQEATLVNNAPNGSSDWVSILRSRALEGQERLHQSERAISRLACQSTSLQRCLDRDDGHRSAPALMHGVSARCASCSCRLFPSTPRQQGRSRLVSTTPGNNRSVAIMAAKLGLDTNTTTSTSCVWTSALETPCRDGQRGSNDAQPSCEATGKNKHRMTRTASHDSLFVPNQENGSTTLSELEDTRGSPLSRGDVNERCSNIGKPGTCYSYESDHQRLMRPETASIANSSNLVDRASDSDDNRCSNQSVEQSSLILGGVVRTSQSNRNATGHNNGLSCTGRKTSSQTKALSSSPNTLAEQINAISTSAGSSKVNSQRISESNSQASPKSENIELVPEIDADLGSLNSNCIQTDGSRGSASSAFSSELLVTSLSQCQGSTSPKFRTKPKSRTLRNKVLARNLFTAEGETHKAPSPAHSEGVSPPQLSALPQLLVPTSFPDVAPTTATDSSEKTDIATNTSRPSSDQPCRVNNSTAANNSTEFNRNLSNSCEDPGAFLVQGNGSSIVKKESYVKNKTLPREQHIENAAKLNNGICLQQDLQCNTPTVDVLPSTPPNLEEMSTRSKSPTFRSKTPQGQTKALRFSTSTPLVNAARTATLQQRDRNPTNAPSPSSRPAANPLQVTPHPSTLVESADSVGLPPTAGLTSNACLSSGTMEPASSSSVCSGRPDPDDRPSNHCSYVDNRHLAETAESLVPPIALVDAGCHLESKRNPIDILCSPVKVPSKPKLENLTLQKNSLEIGEGKCQSSINSSNQLAHVESKNQKENLDSPSNSTFVSISDAQCSNHPSVIQNQSSPGDTSNLSGSVGELSHCRPEQTASKSEAGKLHETQARDAVSTDSGHHIKAFINMTTTPVQTTPRVSKLSLHGLKKLEMLKKKQTPARSFLYPTSSDEPNRRASSLSYTDNIEDSARFSGFIDADITTRLPPAAPKCKEVQNLAAGTNMNRDVKVTSTNSYSSPKIECTNIQKTLLDSISNKEPSPWASQNRAGEVSISETKCAVMSSAIETDELDVPLEIADSIQAWQQNSMSEDMENFLINMSTQKMISGDRNSSNNLIDGIELVQQTSSSGHGKGKGQCSKLTLTPTTAEMDVTQANNKRKISQNSNNENAPPKYFKSSPLLRIPPNESSVTMNIENGDLNGTDLLTECSGKSPTSAASALTSGPAGFSGFSTAGGKHIAVNDAALNKAKMLWNNCDETDSTNDKSNVIKAESKRDASLTDDADWETSIDRSSSAINALESVTETALEKGPLLSGEAGINRSNATTAVPKTAGFTTARGNAIPVNEASLRKASRFWSEWGEIGENSPATTSVSNLQTVKGCAQKCEEDESNCTSFASFKTVKSAPVSMNEKSLEARQVITACEKTEGSNLSSTAFKGFTTAKGTAVPVKEDALKRAKQLLAECSESVTSTTKPMINLGFTTAKGSIIKVGEEALKKAKSLLAGDESAEHMDIGPASSSAAAERHPIAGREEIHSPVPLLGFKTAKGSVIEVRQDALEKAKRLWNDIGPTEDTAGLGFHVPEVAIPNEMIIDNHTKRLKTMEENGILGKQEGSSGFPTTNGFTGFKTANGAVLVVDPEAVKKAKALWDSSNDSDDAVVPTSQLNHIRPVEVPPLGGKVVRPPLGKTQKRGFIKHKVDTSKISGESCRLPEPASFKGAPCADISGRVYPKNVGRVKPTENTKPSWSVPTRTTQTGSNCNPMLSNLTADEQEMLNAQLSSITEEFLQDDDWNIEEEPILTTDCGQNRAASNGKERGSKSGGTAATAQAEKSTPLNETSLSDNFGKDATPAAERLAAAGTIHKQANLGKLDEENVDPLSDLRETDGPRGSLKLSTAPPKDGSISGVRKEVTKIGDLSPSSKSLNNYNGRISFDCGVATDTSDLEKDAAAAMQQSQDTSRATAYSLAATNPSVSSAGTNTSPSTPSIVKPSTISSTVVKLHATSGTIAEQCKSGTIISVPTPNNFTPFSAPQRTPTKGSPSVGGDAVSPVLLRSRQIKSKIQQLREQYGTPKALPPLQASPVVLKAPFKTPLRSQSGDQFPNT